MKKILKYIFMLCVGIWLSMGCLKIADIFISFMMNDGVPFSAQGPQYLLTMIIYITIIFPCILILLSKISKKW